MASKLDFSPADIEKLYENQATKYADFSSKSFSWRYIEKPLIEDVISKTQKNKIKILDAGCGNGRVLKYLTDYGIPNNNITGVDISKDMIEIAKRHNPDVELVVSDLVKYSSRDHFDLILCIHVLNYVNDNDFKTVLKNFYNLLNKGGILFFVLTHPVRTTRHNLSEYFKRDWIVDHTPWGTTTPLFLRTVSDIVNRTIEADFTLKLLEEPNIPIKAKKSDPNGYSKYACCPSRIAVLAVK